MSSAIDNNSAAKSYLDFSGLGELRGKALKDQNSALKESAQQFEGLFIQMMMKSMREANAPMKDDGNQSYAMETFEGMFDKEVSLQMSKRSSLGVAEFLESAVKRQNLAPLTTEEILSARNKGIPLNAMQAPIQLISDKNLHKGFKLDKNAPLKNIIELGFPFSGGHK